ncbi:MAG: VOC family protein [Longimicrobiaceae bacterium]
MLSPACVPMLFRGAADPGAAGRLAAEVLGWPALGGALYDAGNAVVGFTPAGADAGTDLDPAWELEVVPADWDDAVLRLAAALGRTVEEMAGSVAYDAVGRSLAFHDAAGNLTVLAQPTWRARVGRAGRKLGGLMAVREEEGGASAVVGATLHVSSLPRSLRFYRDRLGMAPLRVTPREARFDAGPLILTLRAERRVGMVADAARRGALRDTLVFRVDELEAEVAALAARGVEIPPPRGGGACAERTAGFADPDGHRLVLWEPPDPALPGPPRSYASVLERIAARAAASHESRFALEAP